MKLEVLSLTEKALAERDYRNVMQININGKKAFRVMDGEPEDSNLSRDFSDCWSIPKLIERVYNAGKKNEELTIENKEVEEI